MKRVDKTIPKVIIADADKPLPVVLETAEPASPQIVNKGDGKTLAPTTTAQDDLTTAGQRRVNLIWEFTQAIVAVMITSAVIFKSDKSEVINYAFFLIVSMYFIRTNHKLIGGIGPKPYEGR